MILDEGEEGRVEGSCCLIDSSMDCDPEGRVFKRDGVEPVRG